MRRNSRAIGVGVTAACVAILIGSCSFSKDKCADVKTEIDALAHAYSGAGPEQAYAKCQDALVTCPKIASAYKLMGTIDKENKEYGKAIANYTKAFELNADDPGTTEAIRQLSVYSIVLTGNRISILDKKKITSTPFNVTEITLQEYSQLDKDVRLPWLQSRLEELNSKMTEEAKKKGHEWAMNVGGVALEVDESILSQAAANANRTLGQAYEKAAMDTMYRHLTVTLMPRR